MQAVVGVVLCAIAGFMVRKADYGWWPVSAVVIGQLGAAMWTVYWMKRMGP
jgi:hypothetical protein